MPNIPDPITREETYLAKAAGSDVNVPKPITRTEFFLNEIIERGGGGGGDITVDSELSSSSKNPVQNRVINAALTAKADLSALNSKQDVITVTAVTGTTPSITLTDNTVFTAGELTSLTITGSLNDGQVCVITFESGTTPTQLTVPSGLMMPDSFAVEADTIYEISIMGDKGAVQSWAN